jgi:phospholipase D1/2
LFQGRPRTRMDQHLFRIGHNVCRVEHADRLRFLVDGCEYFSQLAKSIRLARRQIWIVGWDFNPRIRLTPQCDDPVWLDDLLLARLEAEPDLTIRILVWGMGPVYSGKSLKMFRRSGLLGHPRVDIRFDFSHPFMASHHQKMVAIDGDCAFIGGIDLTEGRWDDNRHLPDNSLRVKQDGSRYEPVHDIQAMVEGDAARAVQDLAQARWHRRTGEAVAPGPEKGRADREQGSETADVTGIPIALSVTDRHVKRGKSQSVRLALDAIAAARSHIYIEAQYLASFRIAEALAARLKSPDAPEIVVIVTRISHGLIERQIMGRNRSRIIRKLKRQDAHDRLWVMYAVVPDAVTGDEQEVLIHSKLMIVDDEFVRIGSSNLNHRSERFDTEADLSTVARNAEERRAIANLRSRLMAEHMGVSSDAVASTFLRTGSLHETIRANNKPASRGFRHFDVDLQEGSTSPALATPIVDPSGTSIFAGAARIMKRIASTRARNFLRFLGWKRDFADR